MLATRQSHPDLSRKRRKVRHGSYRNGVTKRIKLSGLIVDVQKDEEQNMKKVAAPSDQRDSSRTAFLKSSKPLVWMCAIVERTLPSKFGPTTMMWPCPDCADGVSEELVALVHCAECAEI